MDPLRLRLIAVVMPPVVVAALAMTHPTSLTVESASHWKQMHIWLIPVFPLLALGPWLVARSVDRTAGVVVGLIAYAYATAYTTLDIIAGVVGGAIKEVEAGGLGIVFPLAGHFEDVGGIAYVLAAALAAGVAMNRTGWLLGAIPTVLVVLGGYLLWQHHIFRPWGPIAQVMLALGWGAFVLLLSRGAAASTRDRASDRTSARPGAAAPPA